MIKTALKKAVIASARFKSDKALKRMAKKITSENKFGPIDLDAKEIVTLGKIFKAVIKATRQH